jgi:hypothetical protein
MLPQAGIPLPVQLRRHLPPCLRWPKGATPHSDMQDPPRPSCRGVRAQSAALRHSCLHALRCSFGGKRQPPPVDSSTHTHAEAVSTVHHTAVVYLATVSLLHAWRCSCDGKQPPPPVTVTVTAITANTAQHKTGQGSSIMTIAAASCLNNFAEEVFRQQYVHACQGGQWQAGCPPAVALHAYVHAMHAACCGSKTGASPTWNPFCPLPSQSEVLNGAAPLAISLIRPSTMFCCSVVRINSGSQMELRTPLPHFL